MQRKRFGRPHLKYGCTDLLLVLLLMLICILSYFTMNMYSFGHSEKWEKGLSPQAAGKLYYCKPSEWKIPAVL